MKSKFTIHQIKIPLLIAILTLQLYFFPFGFINFGGGWHLCIEFLSNGVLYENQIYCNQAPLIYYYGFLVNTIFGWELFDSIIHLTIIALWITLAITLKSILIIEDIWNEFIFFIIYILLIIPPSVNNPEVMFSTIFLIGGFYFLQYIKFEQNIMISAFLFALSIFFKYTAFIPFILIISTYIYSIRDKTSSKTIITRLGILFLPLIILTVVFNSIHPKLLDYTFFSQIAYPEVGLLKAISLMFTTLNIHAIALTTLMIILALGLRFGYFKSKELFPIISFAIIIIALSLTKSHGNFQSPSYYALSAYPFLIISLLILYKNDKRIFYTAFIICVLYPSIVSNSFTNIRDSYMNKYDEDLQNLVSSGLSYIPNQKGKILIETGREQKNSIIESSPNTRIEQIEYIYPSNGLIGPSDPFWGPRVKKILDNRLIITVDDIPLTTREKEIREKILNGGYSTIFYGPPRMTTIPRILRTIPRSVLNQFCEVRIPNYLYHGGGRFFSTMIFSNRSYCPIMSRQMTNHYLNNFDKICEMSQDASRIVWEVLRLNGFILQKKCGSGAKVTDIDMYKIQIIDIILVIICLIVVNTYLKSG